MLLTVAGALLVATLAVVAARALHERRALSAEVRSLREEVRLLNDRLAAAERRAEDAELDTAELLPGAGSEDASAGAGAPGAATTRGPRTLH